LKLWLVFVATVAQPPRRRVAARAMGAPNLDSDSMKFIKLFACRG